MEFLSSEFLSALLALIVIDLVLAGDNAIVIGLAARNLPKESQGKVIIWGTVGAIVVRALATLAVVWLLKVPGLLLVGGILLIYISYKLMVEEKKHEVQAGSNLWGAIRTIIIADAIMGLDNVLAVAGAAHGNFLLVILGLLISVPIVVWGSTVILKLTERYPVIVSIGAGVLAWTAANMITSEPLISNFFSVYPILKWLFAVVVILGILVAGRIGKNKAEKV